MEILLIIAKVIWVIFVVDLLSGLLHWAEDAYGQEHWPITGNLVTKPNILHHHDPRAFTSNSWFYSARLLIVICAVPLAVAYALGIGGWAWWLAFLIGINANEIHKWAHQSPQENGRFITFLQNAGIIQSVAHHAEHHKGYKNTHYCVITNYLNPVLERMRFWDGLEWIVYKVTGVKHRPDHSVRSSLLQQTPSS